LSHQTAFVFVRSKGEGRVFVPGLCLGTCNLNKNIIHCACILMKIALSYDQKKEAKNAITSSERIAGTNLS